MQRDSRTSAPPRPADITGRVTTRYETTEPLVLLVEVPGDHEKAYVEVGPTTPVLRRADGDVPASRTDLAIGVLVSAWYSGPVRETYPPMATAEAIVVLERMPTGTGGRGRPSTEERLITNEDPGEP